jgi:hypothetical protein
VSVPRRRACKANDVFVVRERLLPFSYEWQQIEGIRKVASTCRQQNSCAVLAVWPSANAVAGGSVGLQPVVSH